VSTPGLRTCPGCKRPFAMLYICENCGRCDAQDLPRDADRPPCCKGSCRARDWRSEQDALEQANEVIHKHVTEQLWVPEVREDGVYLVAADDHTTVLKLCRPDRDSDLLMAGYVTGLQVHQLRGRGTS
jgi:hypothetical protein